MIVLLKFIGQILFQISKASRYVQAKPTQISNLISSSNGQFPQQEMPSTTIAFVSTTKITQKFSPKAFLDKDDQKQRCFDGNDAEIVRPRDLAVCCFQSAVKGSAASQLLESHFLSAVGA
jgi:hypothetical protein